MKDKLIAFTKRRAELFALCEEAEFLQRTNPDAPSDLDKRFINLSRHLSSDVAKELLEHYSANQPQDEVEKACLVQLKRFAVSYDEAFAEKRQKVLSYANKLWEIRAPKEEYLEALKEVFAVYKKEAEICGYDNHPLNYFIKRNEPYMDCEKLDRIIAKIKPELISIAKQSYEEAVQLDIFLDVKDKDEILTRVLKDTQVPVDYKDIADVRLAFCTLAGPRDVRVAIGKKDFLSAVSGLLHELGHAAYVYNSDEKLQDFGLWLPVSSGYDEASAIIYEQQICAQMPYCEYLSDLLKEKGYDVPAEKIHRVYNFEHRSTTRGNSGRASYLLHIILRYELEKDLLSGKLEVEDLPQVWNAKMDEYMGIVPDTAFEGYMQDVHWTIDFLGYFQSYLLGRVYAYTIFRKLKEEVENVDKDIRRGDFTRINAWLRENFWKYGSMDFIQSIASEEEILDNYIQTLKR